MYSDTTISCKYAPSIAAPCVIFLASISDFVDEIVPCTLVIFVAVLQLPVLVFSFCTAALGQPRDWTVDVTAAPFP